WRIIKALKILNQRIFNSRGFSLMEVMFALALIGIALTTLLASQSQGLSLANEAKFYTTAAFLAQGKMAEIEIAETESIADDSGDFGDDYPDYTWEVEINSTSIDVLEEYADRFKQIDLHVYFGENRVYQYDIRLYKLI
ncbi:MAG: prepilin-type N-terminal cleavage/methylation domain-containing protein, partial [Deltaproteobacteria bacterium]|nr:prepilin-type N-terminal cleavage/methylation domain-containing protein [Deltaproteobacteria bacterium]